MAISREARLVAGVTLLTVPTVMYGGITLVGILTKGAAGLAAANLELSDVSGRYSARDMRTPESGL